MFYQGIKQLGHIWLGVFHVAGGKIVNDNDQSVEESIGKIPKFPTYFILTYKFSNYYLEVNK
jgi:hypothetical protein